MQHGITGMHAKFQALKLKISRSLRETLNHAKLGCVSSRGAHNFYFLAKGLKQHAKLPIGQRATAWIWRCVVAQGQWPKAHGQWPTARGPWPTARGP